MTWWTKYVGIINPLDPGNRRPFPNYRPLSRLSLRLIGQQPAITGLPRDPGFHLINFSLSVIIVANVMWIIEIAPWWDKSDSKNGYISHYRKTYCLADQANVYLKFYHTLTEYIMYYNQVKPRPTNLHLSIIDGIPILVFVNCLPLNAMWC